MITKVKILKKNSRQDYLFSNAILTSQLILYSFVIQPEISLLKLSIINLYF